VFNEHLSQTFPRFNHAGFADLYNRIAHGSLPRKISWPECQRAREGCQEEGVPDHGGRGAYDGPGRPGRLAGGVIPGPLASVERFPSKISGRVQEEAATNSGLRESKLSAALAAARREDYLQEDPETKKEERQGPHAVVERQ
jgi:hypothetical protein